MIRKAVLVICTCLALAALVVWIASLRHPVHWDLCRKLAVCLDEEGLPVTFWDLPAEVRQRWLYILVGDNQVTMTYSNPEVPPWVTALGSNDPEFRPERGLLRNREESYVGNRNWADLRWERRLLLSGWRGGDLISFDEKHIAEISKLRRKAAERLSGALGQNSFVFRYRTTPSYQLVLRFPLLLLILQLAAFPMSAGAYRVVRRHRLRRAGRCVRCGYDLTGNTSGVCPECGRTLG